MNGTESAGRVLDVLLQFMATDDTLGVSDLARNLGVSKAVVHRALQTLVSRGFVENEPVSRKYRLGAAAVLLGVRALRSSDLRAKSMPVLERLHVQTGETVTLSVRVPNGRVYLDQIISRKEMTMAVEVGPVFPLHAGSSSKCILAFLSPARQLEVLQDKLVALTDGTITDPAVLGHELELVRACGYATSEGERQAEAGSIASPIFGMDNSIVGAISVCGPKSRVTKDFVERIAPLVVAAADEISASIGATRRGTWSA
jgi:DNA-binding IclR family transcriptional regulator